MHYDFQRTGAPPHVAGALCVFFRSSWDSLSPPLSFQYEATEIESGIKLPILLSLKKNKENVELL